jgi:hypothetical protein
VRLVADCTTYQHGNHAPTTIAALFRSADDASATFAHSQIAAIVLQLLCYSLNITPGVGRIGGFSPAGTVSCCAQPIIGIAYAVPGPCREIEETACIGIEPPNKYFVRAYAWQKASEDDKHRGLSTAAVV